MPRKIIMLDDGETWAGNGTVLELTDDAFTRLCDGIIEPQELVDDDILSEEDILPPEDDET
jgi:hypothetical protein